MNDTIRATSALISVFDKKGLIPLVRKLNDLGIKLYSTGGTEKFIRELGIEVIPVESVTGYPSILGGRVKTLHPKVFGGILNRRDHSGDSEEVKQYEIPHLDMVIVDLYPFEKAVAEGASEEEIIEKIDIGGISLIRAAAKNFRNVLCVASVEDYADFMRIITHGNGSTTLAERRYFATRAFHISSHYDTAIFKYFNRQTNLSVLKISEAKGRKLRYGENPHQEGYFFGDMEGMFEQLHGKALSYNNLLDVDAAVQLMSEFKGDEPTFAILKHTNACGVATRKTPAEAYKTALAGDPVSAFGGILAANREIDEETAAAIHSLFCEVVIAPSFSEEALTLLQQKKNRILLLQKAFALPETGIRSCLNGFLFQDRDRKTDSPEGLTYVTRTQPDERELQDLLFAAKISKHTKSNTIVLARDKQLCASGTGQTSRVDALTQAIEKATSFSFDLKGAVMASDAFFPFPDCVEIAHKAGIKAVIQPGGSVKDELSIAYCDAHDMAMVFTHTRHFKH